MAAVTQWLYLVINSHISLGAIFGAIRQLLGGCGMSQDRKSGAAANKWGRRTARKIATQIGAVMVDSYSNEARFRGKRVVIKCAKPATNSVGVTFKMLGRLDSIIGALQLSGGSFELRSLARSVFKSEMRETRSRGDSTRKVGQVRRSVFVNQGKLLGQVRISRTH